MPAGLDRAPFRLSGFLLSLSDSRVPCEYVYSAAVAATPWGEVSNFVRQSDLTADAELLRLAQQGSRAAWEALYRRYLPSVWRYVHTQVHGDQHAAEDIVSETFLALVRSLKKLDADGGPLYPWLIGVARHKVGDHWRQVGHRRDDRLVAGQQQVDPVHWGNPSACLETAETRRQVAEAMAGLSDEERLVLEWKYVDDLPVHDIAQRLGRTEKAVESLLYLARNSFRAVFRRRQGSAD